MTPTDAARPASTPAEVPGRAALPYYADNQVTLYHGDCREITDWLTANVLITDPPYGIKWRNNLYANKGINNDNDTDARDSALHAWGTERPTLVFGSVRAPFPVGWQRMLVFRTPVLNTGLIGNRLPWFKNWEPVFVLGKWPDQTPSLDAVISTSAPCAGGYSGYATRYGHSHAKPVDVMEQLINACPLGMVADPFAGSGSTLIAARNLGRQAIGIEIEERYCEIAARRLAQNVLDFEEAIP